MSKWVIGVIGGSGLYEIAGLEDAEEVRIDTPWGAPSDVLVKGRVGDVDLVFLPRHGKGHVLSPTSVPYRANIDALKRLGCTDVLSISACGSLQEQYAPGEFVMVDQFIDCKHGRRAIDADRSNVEKQRRSAENSALRQQLRDEYDGRKANYETWRQQLLALRKTVASSDG